MGHYSEDTDDRPFETGSPNHTHHKCRLIHSRDGHPPTTLSSITDQIMAEGGTQWDIPVIPPPPRTNTKTTTGPNTDQQQTPEPNTQPTKPSDASNETVDIAEEVLKRIEENLEDEDLEDIPDVFNNIPIECFCEDTQQRLCYHLEAESAQNPDTGYTKDYMGFGEWIGLETLFMKYLHRTVIKHKTIEVLCKWITYDGGRRPTIGNFKECMLSGLDRPDVVADLARHIIKDAISWSRTGSEACTVPHKKVDKSWQLTRHDVIKGVKMMYTCCLAYADEDEGMAQIITDLYTKVSPGTLFFRPQWDLKHGKYVYDTTARVIEERCGGRVLFLISEYFLASNVCRFAANFAITLTPESDTGKLVPFLLTDNYAHIPSVLRGITGIKWNNTWSRETAWTNLPDAFFHCEQGSSLDDVKARLRSEVRSYKEIYLCDPPYDEGIGPPKDPVFSADSEECRVSPFQDVNTDFVPRLTKMNKFKKSVSKKLVRLTKPLRRLRGRGGVECPSTNVNSACEGSDQGSRTSVFDMSSYPSASVLIGDLSTESQ